MESELEPVAGAPRLGAVARARKWALGMQRQAFHSVRDYFVEQDPTFWTAFTAAIVIAALLFVRSPQSNYIFDEQEALLANPYVNGRDLRFWDAFRRDFWGLSPDRTIGSYRPIPNLIWRLLWHISDLPWLHHWINVVVHAANGALVSVVAFALTRRRRFAWLAGLSFVASAVLTEAVSGVVGLADVLAGFAVLLAVAALRAPLFISLIAVYGATLFGLFSKESAIVIVPLVAWTALVTAPLLHPEKPRRWLRAFLAVSGALGALVTYTYFRRHFFPVEAPKLPELAHASAPLRGFYRFLEWFRQPRLPIDPINNPLADAGVSFPRRVAGALRVYFRSLVQVVFPWRLSGDYSFRAEPAPVRVLFPESVLGAFAMVVPPLIAIAAWVRAILLERRARRLALGAPLFAHFPNFARWVVIALSTMWIPLAYFPHSNIPLLLPTVRAERFLYIPAIGAAFLIALLLDGLAIRWRFRKKRLRALWAFSLAFFGMQVVKARAHALDYTDDLAFWRATRASVPESAKAQLNYSVMLGTRGQLEERLKVNRRAIEIAPNWAMARVYYADTLCRMRRAEEAWPTYRRGFEMAPGDSNLIALGLQCLWDEKVIPKHEAELLELSDKHPGTWLAYLASEIVYNGEKNQGIEKKYRPRGYDEGPKH